MWGSRAGARRGSRALAGPLGGRCPSSSRRRGLQPSSPLLGRARPQAGRVKRRQQRGSHLVEDSALAEALSRPFLPDALAAAPQVQVRGAAAGRARGGGARPGAAAREGRTRAGRGGGEREASLLLATGILLRGGERRGSRFGSGLVLRGFSGGSMKGRGRRVPAVQEAAGVWGRERDGKPDWERS